MTDNFSFFMPLSKIDKEKRLVMGYASTPAKDLDGEVVSLDAIKKALPGYMAWRNIRRMHTPDAVGVAKEANVDSKGLFLTAKIIDDDAWQKCIEGVYKGFSIGGKKLAKSGDTITEIDLVEISVVDRPANPECRFDVSKSAKGAEAAHLARVPKISPEIKLLAKALNFAEGVGEFLQKNNPPAARDGFSLPVEKTAKLCKAHDKASCPDCTCDLHKAVDCEKCMSKRDFSAKERDQAASSGAAMPDGSFPIKDESDLHNAIRLAGNAKDPKMARKHIKSRAKALGLSEKIPETWSKKFVKSQAAIQSLDVLAKFALGPPQSAEPSFLTLTVDGGLEQSVEGLGCSHEPKQNGKAAQKLAKRMSAAGSLAYCFDQVRSAQRSLMYEAKGEGGDTKDKALAEKLGLVAQGLAAVIGQKAEHEGAEALDFSDVDDRGVNSLFEDMEMSAQSDPLSKAIIETLMKAAQPSPMSRLAKARDDVKKARKAVKDAEDMVKAVHAMHKAGYLAKAAGKKDKPDADEFDHAGAMEKLQKAFNSITTAKTMAKSAGEQMKKVARAGQDGQEATDGNSFFEVPMGVKNLEPEHMATLPPGGTSSGGMPPENILDQVFANKNAKGMISEREAHAIARAAAAEAENNLLKSMPSGNRRPQMFDLAKVQGGGAGDGTTWGLPNGAFKGVNPQSLVSDNEEVRKTASANVIGNFLLGGHGKSIVDPAFRGTAGAQNANL